MASKARVRFCITRQWRYREHIIRQSHQRSCWPIVSELHMSGPDVVREPTCEIVDLDTGVAHLRTLPVGYWRTMTRWTVAYEHDTNLVARA